MTKVDEVSLSFTDEEGTSPMNGQTALGNIGSKTNFDSVFNSTLA